MAHRLLSTAKRVEKLLLHGVQHGRLNTSQVRVLTKSTKLKSDEKCMLNYEILGLCVSSFSCNMIRHFFDSTDPMRSNRYGVNCVRIRRKASINTTNPVGRPVKKMRARMPSPAVTVQSQKYLIHHHPVEVVAATVNRKPHRTMTGILVCSDRMLRIRAVAAEAADRSTAKTTIKKSGSLSVRWELRR